MHGSLTGMSSALNGDHPSKEDSDAKGLSVGKEKIHRVGFYLVEEIECRFAAKSWYRPVHAYYYLRYRVGLDVGG